MKTSELRTKDLSSTKLRTPEKKKKVCFLITSVAKPQTNSATSANQKVTVVKGNSDATQASGPEVVNKLGASSSSSVNQFSGNSFNQTFIIGGQQPVPPQENTPLLIPSTQSIQPSYNTMLPATLGLNSFPSQTAGNMWVSPTPIMGMVPAPVGVPNSANVPMMQAFMQPNYQQLSMQNAQMQMWQNAAQSQAYALAQQDVQSVAIALNTFAMQNPQYFYMVKQHLLNYAQLIQNVDVVDYLTNDQSGRGKKKYPRQYGRAEDENGQITPEAFAVMFKNFINEQSSEQGGQADFAFQNVGAF